jgi:hypothetical protein
MTRTRTLKGTLRGHGLVAQRQIRKSSDALQLIRAHISSRARKVLMCTEEVPFLTKKRDLTFQKNPEEK